MNHEERIAALQAKYPKLFRDGGPRSGFSIGEGWMHLVESLCAVINNHIEHSVPQEINEELFVAQVKEKFGGLRFYMNASTPYISGVIDFAEAMSYGICEECGKPGTRRNSGWVKTLCDKDHKKNQVRRTKIVKKAIVKLKKGEFIA